MADTTGKRVRLEDDERLDIPDARAMQDLQYNHFAELLAALLGPDTAGALTGFTSWVRSGAFPGSGVIKPGDGTVAFVLPVAGRNVLWTHRYDSTTAKVVSGAAALVDSVDFPYIWATVVPGLPADLDTRRFWSTVGQEEVASVINTRITDQIAFQAADTKPTGAWFRIAKVAAWEVGLPTIVPIHPFDSLGVINALTATDPVSPVGSNLSAWALDTFAPTNPQTGISSGQLRPSLSAVISVLMAQVGRILFSDATTNANSKWTRIPPASLNTLDDRLSTIEAKRSNAVALRSGTYTVTAIPGGILPEHPDWSDAGTPGMSMSVRYNSQGNYTVTLQRAAQGGFALTAVHITPHTAISVGLVHAHVALNSVVVTGGDPYAVSFTVLIGNNSGASDDPPAISLTVMGIPIGLG